MTEEIRDAFKDRRTKMIDWKTCSESMPNDNDECILYNKEVDIVIGPIIYKKDFGGWIDLFATPEAGHLFRPGDKSGPTHWAMWNEPEKQEA